MQVDRARNCFLDLHGKFSLSLSEILKKVVWPHLPFYHSIGKIFSSVPVLPLIGHSAQNPYLTNRLFCAFLDTVQRKRGAAHGTASHRRLRG